MVEISLDRLRRPAALLRPYAAPILHHAGWLGFFLILAPVVGPHDYGVFILGLSVVAIPAAVMAGAATYVLDALPNPEDQHWSTALVTMVVAGAAVAFGLYAGLYAGADAIGSIIGGSELGDIVRSLAMLPLLGGLVAVPSAALRREGRTVAITAANLAGLAAGGGIAVAMAWAGAGAWVFVVQIVVQRLVECTVLWAVPGRRMGIAWSRPHFAELVGRLDLGAVATISTDLVGSGACLVAGLALGPTATGLYALALRLADASREILFVGAVGSFPRETVHRACRIALPAVLASFLLVIAAPLLLDLLWWGAVWPAQIMLLGAVPAAVSLVRDACARRASDRCRWQIAEAFGSFVVTLLAAPYGLPVIAAANLGWVSAVAVAGLWPLHRSFGVGWAAALGTALRPIGGAAAAAMLLSFLVEPISLVLAPVPAVCLSTAAGWLVYLMIRGDPVGAARPAPRAVLGIRPVDG